MSLSSYLVDKFAKATVNKQKIKKETTVYGTIEIANGRPYAKIDGSDTLTPVMTTADVKTGNRVMIQLKDHSAVVIGNISSPSASSSRVSEIVFDQQKIDRIDIENGQIKIQLQEQYQNIEQILTDIISIKTRLSNLENK